MRPSGRVLALSCAAALLTAVPAPRAAPAGALTEGARLAAIYDSILAAKFPLVDARLREACPPAPDEACAVLRVASIWWQININPESLLLDEKLEEAADAAIEAAAAWTEREPARAEAWFYLAGAYAPRTQWRILRGERLAAAREGKKIKDALERALALDPSLGDAHFGIGLYHYYAAVAPAYARFLRWLLLLPGGDRQRGLQEMITARDEGELLAGEADYQLHLVYLWYEKRPRDALALLESLDARYPTNPLFVQRIGEVQRTYFHDARASAAAWRDLLDRAIGHRVYSSTIAETRARLGLAEALIDLGERDDAAAQLQIVIDERPISPPGARKRAEALLAKVRAPRKF